MEQNWLTSAIAAEAAQNGGAQDNLPQPVSGPSKPEQKGRTYYVDDLPETELSS